MKVEATEDMPAFLVGLRERAAAFAGLEPVALQQVLLTEYGPGAGIGWHKDRSVFGEAVGISLLAPCVFRLRRKTAAKPRPAWQRLSLTLAPRSAYLLAGPARSDWEHSIPEVESLRYSVTFRNLRRGEAANCASAESTRVDESRAACPASAHSRLLTTADDAADRAEMRRLAPARRASARKSWMAGPRPAITGSRP